MRVRVVVVVAMLAGAVLAGPAQAADRYTALGDSFAAGPLIPNPVAPLGCLKSSNNYGRIAQRTLAFPEYRDATCSGAATEDMFAPQNVSPGGPNPPQLNSLSTDTKLVTLTIGGNDIGFSDLAQDCVSVLPFGSPCRDQYTRGGDQISARIATAAVQVSRVLDEIRFRSPLAKILVVNYAAIFPHAPSSGCWPRMPVTPRDVAWLRSKHEELNAMLATQARTNNRATVVDVYGASVGRSACAGSGTRWVEPYVPGNAAAPLHPNRRGMDAMAAMVVANR
jgi:lysophospholipase L1-like esterase